MTEITFTAKIDNIEFRYCEDHNKIGDHATPVQIEHEDKIFNPVLVNCRGTENFTLEKFLEGIVSELDGLTKKIERLELYNNG